MTLKRIITLIVIVVIAFLVVPEQTIRNIPYAEQLQIPKVQVYIKSKVNFVKQKVVEQLSQVPIWIENLTKKMVDYGFNLIKIEVNKQLNPGDEEPTEVIPETNGG